jgi:hypothetical protein
MDDSGLATNGANGRGAVNGDTHTPMTYEHESARGEVAPIDYDTDNVNNAMSNDVAMTLAPHAQTLYCADVVKSYADDLAPLVAPGSRYRRGTRVLTATETKVVCQRHAIARLPRACIPGGY